MTNRVLVSPYTNARELREGGKHHVRMTPGNQYQIVHDGNEEATVKEAVEAVREGQHLTIRYPDGTEVWVADYYEVCARGACSLSLGDGSEAGFRLNPDMPVAWAGPTVVYQIAAPEPPVVASVSPAEVPAAPTVVAADEASAWGAWKWVGLGGLAAAASGAGGGGGQVDATEPALIGSVPADGELAVLVGSNIVLTFSETVVAGNGSIVISNGTDTRTISVIDTSQVTISGNTVTLNPTVNLQANSTYNVQMAVGVLEDASGNAFAGITGATALNFNTQDLVAPNLTASTPADNATAVPVGSNIVLTFSETVVAGSGNIVISNGSDTRTISVIDTSQVTISGNIVTLTPAVNLQANSTYNVQMSAGVLEDASGNPFAGVVGPHALEFSTQDLVPPTLGGSAPASNATAVMVNSNIVLTFSETVVAGSGDIVISNGTDTRTISVTDVSQVSVSGNIVTINPIQNLVGNSQYTVEMASGVFTDLSVNMFVGLSGNDLSFNTAAAILSLDDIAASSGGFLIDGSGASESSGYSVSSAGDVNGDGLDDLLIGARGDNAAAGIDAGRSFVVFGGAGPDPIALSAIIAGSGGFVINGAYAGARSGTFVSAAGDVNGDGLSDLIVGEDYEESYFYYEDYYNNGDYGTRHAADAQHAYVVFGRTGTDAVNLHSYGIGSDGFVIDGFGRQVSGAGDVNGDGLADLVVGDLSISYSDYYGVTIVGAGQSCVIFGKADNDAVSVSELATSGGGFVIDQQYSGDGGFCVGVAGAGDINGDGFGDLILSRAQDNGLGGIYGEGYVVFGKSGTGRVDLNSVAGGVGGFLISGDASVDHDGDYNVDVAGIGDVNGDGLADVAFVGAGKRVYVAYGKTEGAAVSLPGIAQGNGGFLIVGGSAVSSAGDVNGDGLSDLIIAEQSSTNEVGNGSGRTYVVFGKTDAAMVNLAVASSSVSAGFIIDGQWSGGSSVSAAGDVNGDGLDDLLVGAPSAGCSYVIFGNTAGVFERTAIDLYGTGGADFFNDDGINKSLVAGAGDDILTATAASILYGGAGDDIFNINATMITALQSAMGSGGNLTQLARIDGGTGIDSIALSGSGLTLDLTQVANQAASNPDGGSRIDSVERIDLAGTGNNTLKLQLRDVLDMGSANTFVTNGQQQLLVTGNSGDTLDLAEGSGTTGWTQSGTVSISSVTYNVWNHDTALATVYVSTNLTVI